MDGNSFGFSPLITKYSKEIGGKENEEEKKSNPLG